MAAHLVGGNKTHIKIKHKFIRAIVYENQSEILKNKQNLQSLFIGNSCDGTSPSKLS